MSIRPGAPPGAPPGAGTGHQRATESAPRRSGVHRAWFVAAAVVSALIAAAGFRSSTGALIEPLEATFGWSRTTTSGAVTVNLVLFGVTAPFAAALMGLRDKI